MNEPTSKAPYGTGIEYADPGYQSDKQKRYPIDTEAHARAAWSYINKASNASAYSSEDLAKVKARIRAACKKFGIEISDESDNGGNGDDSESKGHDSILCRATVQLAPTLTGEPMYMPGGVQEITPFSGGIGVPIKVNVDAIGAAALEEQRAALVARGKKPYFDFNHEDGPASFWPEKFYWKGDGIYAQGEWTSRGKKSVEGKDFRYFSPVFHVDNKRGDPARIVCRGRASPNMGGLTNDPAFQILPLWAKNRVENDAANAGDGDSVNTKTIEEIKMSEEEIAALRAKQQELETKVDELKAAKEAGADNDDAMRAALLEMETTELRIKSKAQDEIIARRAREDAKAAVLDAVKRGAIAGRDKKTQKELEDLATGNPSFIGTIKAMQGNAALYPDRIGGRLEITAEDPVAVYCKLARTQAPSGRGGHIEKMRSAREFQAVYAQEFKGDQLGRLLSFSLSELTLGDAIMAADVTDASLGTLAGTLVTQRTLELLKFQFPSLNSFTTDFSDQPVTFNQTVMSRTITIPGVSTYSTSTGWADATAATTDVPVTLNNHKGVQITFNEQIMASTVRKLFEEFAPAQSYALGKALVDALYANITDANFTNNQVSTAAAFNRAAVIDLATNLTLRGVPLMPGNRTLLLYSTFFGALEKDAAIVSLATYQRPELITGPTQAGASYAINVEGFQVINAPNMPTNNANANGFAGSKSALLMVTRTPNDYASILPGASFGNVQMVTEPDIGITVMLVQYVNHLLASATSRIALMYGTAAGQGSAGTILKSNAGSGSSH